MRLSELVSPREIAVEDSGHIAQTVTGKACDLLRVHPVSESRVTAVPLREIHAFLNAFGAQGRRCPFVRIIGRSRGIELITARKRGVTGTLTFRPVLDCVSVIHFPS